MKQNKNSLLKEYRNTIDSIDDALVSLLGERFEVTDKVGELKATHNFPAQDKSREAEQITRLTKLAKKNNVDPDFIQKFHSVIVHQVLKNHKKINQRKS